MLVSEALSILKISRDGLTKESIMKAFRVVAKETHPDVPGGSPDGFRDANTAKEVLLQHVSIRSPRESTGTSHGYTNFFNDFGHFSMSLEDMELMRQMADAFFYRQRKADQRKAKPDPKPENIDAFAILAIPYHKGKSGNSFPLQVRDEDFFDMRKKCRFCLGLGHLDNSVCPHCLGRGGPGPIPSRGKVALQAKITLLENIVNPTYMVVRIPAPDGNVKVVSLLVTLTYPANVWKQDGVLHIRKRVKGSQKRIVLNTYAGRKLRINNIKPSEIGIQDTVLTAEDTELGVKIAVHLSI